MSYKQFSRKLREKYPTKFHLAEQLIDRNQSLISSGEMPMPLVTALNQINQPLNNRSSKKTVTNPCETYLNECLVAAQQVHRRREIERNRQICYENFFLAEKLKSFEKKNFSKSKEFDTNSTRVNNSTRRQTLNRNGEDSSWFDDEDQQTVADVDSSFDDCPRPCLKRHISRSHRSSIGVVPRAFEKRILF